MTERQDSPALPPFLLQSAWAQIAATPYAPDTDVILSSRARLARNIAGFPFPSRATEPEMRRVAQEVRRAVHADTERLFDLTVVEITALAPRDRAELVDAHRISPELAEGGAETYALLDGAGRVSIFVNEEDHLRLQALAPGNAAPAALSDVRDVEARLTKRITWATDAAKWGFLTASPANMGTGLRLSVLTHLPALVFLNRLDHVFDAAKRLGVSVRGAHGEHSAAAGDLFQVSNTQTFGITVEHTCARVRAFADLLVRDERAARKELAQDNVRRARANRAALAAWERVENAPQLPAKEALEILSSLRLCAACGLLPWGRTRQIRAEPGDRVFAALLAELRTGAGLTDSEGASALRDAIARPALLRSVLAPVYSGA
ncbi:MAG: hypothetical protein H7Y38_18090 [Armatimonadetes bacterium]|nr:hypothetical protein [Armatimonadota bacterium]